jgi:hypothetical protein
VHDHPGFPTRVDAPKMGGRAVQFQFEIEELEAKHRHTP